jgi:ATP-binding cassette subfamily B protein
MNTPNQTARQRAMQNQQRPMGGPMGRGGMMLGGQKARDFGGTMRKLLSYLRPYSLSLGVAVLFAIASTVFTVVGPKVLGLATTKLFEGVISQLTGAGEGIDLSTSATSC